MDAHPPTFSPTFPASLTLHIRWAIVLALLVNAASLFTPIINEGDSVEMASAPRRLELGSPRLAVVLARQAVAPKGARVVEHTLEDVTDSRNDAKRHDGKTPFAGRALLVGREPRVGTAIKRSCGRAGRISQ